MYDEDLQVSVVLPAYNEQENLRLLIPGIVSAVSNLYPEYEIIIVDDGSTDQTRQVVSDLIKQFSDIRYIRLSRNSGLSTALAVGYAKSRGDIIVSMDSDLQYDPNDIGKLTAKLPDYDLVCGKRGKRYDNFFRRLCSKMANKIRSLIIGDGIKDSGCIFRAFHRKAINDIYMFKGFHRFLPAMFKFKDLRVIEVDVNHFPRKHGKSKYNLRNRLVITFLDMLMLKWGKCREIRYEIDEQIP